MAAAASAGLSLAYSTFAHILHGILSKALKVASVGAIKQVKADKGDKFTLQITTPSKEIGSNESDVREAIQAAVEYSRAGQPISAATIPVADSDDRFGRLPHCFQNRFLGKESDTIRIASFPGLTSVWAADPLLSNTSGIGEVEVVSFSFKAKKQLLQLKLSVSQNEGASAVEDGPTDGLMSKEEAAEVFVAPPVKEKKGPAAGAGAGADAAHAGGGAAAKPKGKAKGSGKGPEAPGSGSSAPAAAATTAAAVAAAPASDESGAVEPSGGQTITPWAVDAGEEGVDYGKLIREFGCMAITEDLISRVERLTNRRAHRFLRRGLFFSHRDLDVLLNRYERGEPFYLYTGRGPSSSSLHMGHLIPFYFTQYLQEAFGVPLVIQLTDDEKFLFKDLELEDCHELGKENAKDIIACGFKEDSTFIFSDLDYIGHMYPNICKIRKKVTFNQARGVFGFDNHTNIGCIGFPAVQAAPSFSSSFPTALSGAKNMLCLIPQAIDQDPYFRLTRDVAPRLGYEKPALIHSKFFPSLQGPKTKMSASSKSSTIYVTDTAKQIKKKVGGAFSGGQESVEEQREKGADIEIDVAYQYLRFFLEDDEELEAIGRKYAAGEMLTGEVKGRLVQVLQEIVGEHYKARASVTDEVVERYMANRPLAVGKKAAGGGAKSAAAGGAV